MTQPDVEAIAERVGVRRPLLERFIELCKEPASQWGMADSDVVAICKYAQALEAHIRSLTAENARMKRVFDAAMAWGASERPHEDHATELKLANETRRARAALQGEET